MGGDGPVHAQGSARTRAEGRPAEDLAARSFGSGILHVPTSGCRWRDCPAACGPRTTVYNRFNRSSRRGSPKAVLADRTKAGWAGDAAALDSTSVRAHRSADGGKGVREHRHRVLARRSDTKIHALTDVFGRRPCRRHRFLMLIASKPWRPPNIARHRSLSGVTFQPCLRRPMEAWVAALEVEKLVLGDIARELPFAEHESHLSSPFGTRRHELDKIQLDETGSK